MNSEFISLETAQKLAYNEKINELYNKIDAQDNMINKQALEISKLRKEIELLQNDLDNANSKLSDLTKSHLEAIKCIKNRNTTKSKKERFMTGETTLEKVWKILGDKEKDIELDVLKALNTDLPDDIEMG